MKITNLCIIALLSSMTLSPAIAATQSDLPKISQNNSRAISQSIEPKLQQFINNQKRLKGQGAQILVRVTPDLATQSVFIDVDQSFLPSDATLFDEDFTDQIKEIENKASDLLAPQASFRYTRIRIGGKTLEEIFPKEFSHKKKLSDRAAATQATSGLVVLNPGHGKYFNYSTNTWVYQRPTAYAGTTDVFEDDINPLFSNALTTLLTQRNPNAVTVKNTRDVSNTEIDPTSNLAWNTLGSRYYLKRIYPDLGATIWNKYPNGVNTKRRNLREYDEDISARAAYANHIVAETMISLHTNASGSGTARGAKVYSQLDDTASVNLANNVLCYLREQISQNSTYSSKFSVNSGIGNGASYGEIRDAQMPTALIEVGFHDNTNDSTMLRDANFRQAAMRGVEKGYRLYKAGKTDCEPLKIVSIPTTTGKFRVAIPVPVTISGNPRFPIKFETQNVKCPSGWSCTGKITTFTESPNNMVQPTYFFNVEDSKPAASFTWKSWITDADGVVSNVIEHVVNAEPSTTTTTF